MIFQLFFPDFLHSGVEEKGENGVEEKVEFSRKELGKCECFFCWIFSFSWFLRFEKGNEKIGPRSFPCRRASLSSADFSRDFLAFEMRLVEV